MKKTVCYILNSVSTRVIMIIIALVLPLNILAIIYMNNAKNAIIKQAELNSQKLADYYMQELNARMNNAKSLLSYFMTKDEECIQIQIKNEGNYGYEESKMKFYYKLCNMAEMTDGADGYFYYYKENDDSIIYGNADGGNEMVTQIKNLISGYSAKAYPSGWHIYEWNEKKYMLFLIPDSQVLYGCMLRLDPFLENL